MQRQTVVSFHYTLSEQIRSKEYLMKKSKTIFLVILALGMITACGKKGEPIALPDAASVSSIEIHHGDISAISIDQSFVDEFMLLLQDMEITDRQSVNDAPSVDDYTVIDLNYDDQISTIYYYEKNGAEYVEQPYQGIYKPAPALSEKITELFNSIDGTDRMFTFQATVLEAKDTYILVEPVAGSVELTSSDQISLSNEEGIALQAGDVVEIEYDGSIMETYPAQLGNVYSIRVVTQE